MSIFKKEMLASIKMVFFRGLHLWSSCVGDFNNLKSSADPLFVSSSDVSGVSQSSTSLVDSSPIDIIDTRDDGLTIENISHAESSQEHCIICHQLRDLLTNIISMPKPS